MASIRSKIGECMTESEAIEWIKELKGSEEILEFYYAESFIKALDIAIQALEKQINKYWVPCRDRLPEEVNKYYLVTYRSVICGKFEQGVTVSYLSTFSNGDKSWEIEEEHGNNWMVIAWQPLPKPYKEGEKNEVN